jgi:predicted GNAT family acetyltransferase
MTWHLTPDLDVFDRAAGAFVDGDPALNTIFVTVTAALRRSGLDAFGVEPPRFGWYEGDGARVESVFLQTPPHPVRISVAAAPVAAQLAELLAPTGPVRGVGGPVEAADAFAARWHELTGAAGLVYMRQRLYRLETLTPAPRAVPGVARVCAASDRALLVAWYRAFAMEVGERHGDFGRAVDDRIEYGGLTLWEVRGRPVSLAGVTRIISGTARIAPVYTPKDSRGRGFGGAVTAAVSQAALNAGARDVLLFTDLANPTSNALYQRLGYRPLDDLVVRHFEAR